MNTGLSGSITILILILIKVLFAAFVLGLVVGIIVLIKDTLFSEDEKAKIKVLFTGSPKVMEKKTCAHCGKELKNAWRACPYCGESIENDFVTEA